MDVGAAFVADGEPPETVQPREGALNDPAGRAETTAVRGPSAGQDGPGPTGPQAVAMRLGIVPAVALEGARCAARASATAPHRWQGVDHGVEVRNVVDVRGGYLGDEQDPARVGNEVVFGTRLAGIGWVRASFFPRARRGPNRYRSRSSAGRGARGDGARPAGSRGAVATPRCAATGPSGANTYCLTRSPSAWVTSATECRSGGRRESRSEWRGREWASGRAGGHASGAASGSAVPGAPRSHHQ